MQQVIERAATKDTTLTAFFKANQEYPEVGGDLLYQDYPSKFVHLKTTGKWKPRQRGFAVGRLYYVHPTAGERFYLRLLLTCVRGPTSFEDLLTFQDVQAPSFREACLIRGLLEDDQEWHQCLEEARSMQTGRQLRHLFVTILRDCLPSNPAALWNTFWVYICDDLRYRLQHDYNRLNPTDEDVQDYGLFLIDQLLSYTNKSLADWPTMPQYTQNWQAMIGNHLINEQRVYDAEEQAVLAAEHEARLNQDQRVAFDKILTAVNAQSGQTFFLHGPGGTGKTYVYNTLCYRLRSQAKIVLCVASSGIAALLLKGGHTAHSTFKIPILIHESSTCGIAKKSKHAELICAADLVIWDEAPMQHRHIHEAVDRTFRDVRESDKPFGGLTVVFGGDFQQILPVIIRGSRPQIVSASMQRSALWGDIQVLCLKQNMRLSRDIPEECNFARWQLRVGHGMDTDNEANVHLPDHFKCPENSVPSLINAIYPDIHDPQRHSDQYFSERTILSSRNDDVDDLNAYILHKFPGQQRVFHSADSVPNSTPDQGELMYPVEYLNSINCSGLPLAQVALKIGCPIMVLRNLDPGHGVCNGSRGILTRMRNRVLEARLLTGDHAGETMFIPRITLRPTEDQIPFTFTRRQFPVRLSFAMTINKSQGQSVRHVGLDLRTPVFTHGQFYVAISRVTSVHNIKAIWASTSEEAITKNIVYNEVLLDEIVDNVA
jgi:hypothetical protein